MRLLPLCLSAALLVSTSIQVVNAEPQHVAPPGHNKMVKNDHHDKRDKQYNRHQSRKKYDANNRHDRDDRRHNARQKYTHHGKPDRDRYRQWYKHSGYKHGFYDKKRYHNRHHYKQWHVGRHFARDYYHSARVLYHDPHGYVVVDYHGYIFRLVANSLEVVEILSRH